MKINPEEAEEIPRLESLPQEPRGTRVENQAIDLFSQRGT
jgi:hypothetical protein